MAGKFWKEIRFVKGGNKEEMQDEIRKACNSVRDSLFEDVEQADDGDMIVIHWLDERDGYPIDRSMLRSP